MLLPREVAQRRRAEGLLLLDLVDEPEGPAWPLRAEEHVRQGRDDVQVLRLRQVRGEPEDRDHVDPPRGGEDRARRAGRVRHRQQPRERRRRLVQGEVAGREAGVLEDQQRHHERRDEPKDDVAVEATMCIRGRLEEGAAHERQDDRREHERREHVDRPHEEPALRARHPEAEEAARQEIDGAHRDDDEAPEDERVRDAADVVRPLQELPLQEVDDELVPDALPEMFTSVLVPAEPQVAVQLPRAVRERAEPEDGHGREDQRAQTLGGRGQFDLIRAGPRR